MSWRLSLLGGLACAVLVTGCQCGVQSAPDAGEDFDAGPGGGPADAGEDAGVPDAGPTDAGPVSLSCGGSCHGNQDNAAPPFDTLGGTDRARSTVGAHQAHLDRPGWHRAGQCVDCHLVPTNQDDPGHLGPPPAELVWATIAGQGGVTPAWNGATCDVYCHGRSLSGGALTQPAWTQVSPAPAGCPDCHGAPPPPPHPQAVGTDCSPCHADAAPGLSFSQPQRHIDGVLDVTITRCDVCHGGNGDPAPPRDIAGRSATTLRSVGAHRAHLGPSPTWHAAITCDACHRVPQQWNDPGHLDPSPAELTWGALASARGAVPDWSGTTCSNYCHGQTMSGGNNRTPNWTSVGTGEAACATCHGLPPGPPHPQNVNCQLCHPNLWTSPALHIDGRVQVSATCGACHQLPPQTGTHLLHAGGAPPVYGDLSTAANVTSPSHYSFGCGTCHPLDVSHHLNGGRAEVELYSASAPPDSLKARSPTASYTPGATIFTDSMGLTYTQGTCANVYCHSGPSYSTPGPVPLPAHDFVWDGGYPVSYPPYTVDVGRAYQPVVWGGVPPGCGGCHQYPIRTSEPTVHAMAGQSHSWIDGAGDENGHAWNHGFDPISCRVCHADTVRAVNATSRDDAGHAVYGPVPITGFGRHVNGVADVAFDSNLVTYPGSGGPVSYSLTGASWTPATQTCNDVGCHKLQTAVRSGTPFRWQNGIECDICHRY